MFENIIKFFKKLGKSEKKETKSKETAKERLHLVLMQDRANVSADFLEMMKQEIIEVIKKYIEVDEKEIDVRLTNEVKEDGTTGAPSLYANIPIVNIKNEMKKEMDEKPKEVKKEEKEDNKKAEKKNTEKETKDEKASEKKEEKKNEDKTKEESKKDLSKEENKEEKEETIKTEEPKKENNNENKSGE